ncbi:hypothetical protein [Paenibacillus naphthalenovorans]|uniref:hypothetical protein n=1 Tax=Paenibacillus naphthalenovorans TaxID=162209 RepID=UPI003D2DF108
MAEQVVKWMESNVGSIAENLNGILLAIYGYSLGVAKVIPSLFIFFVVFIIGLYLISFHLPKLYESLSSRKSLAMPSESTHWPRSSVCMQGFN